MPQPFQNPSARAAPDNRTYDELRRDVEQGLDVINQAIIRTKRSGPVEESQWTITRVKTTLDKMKKSPGGDSTVTNRLVAETARWESELRRAEKEWLLKNSSSADASGGELHHRTASEDDPLNIDEELRANLLRVQPKLHDADRLLTDTERTLNATRSTGQYVAVRTEEFGEDLRRAGDQGDTYGRSGKETIGVLRRMANKAFYNRLFLWSVVIMLIMANGLLIYFGYIKNGD